MTATPVEAGYQAAVVLIVKAVQGDFVTKLLPNDRLSKYLAAPAPP